MDLFDLWLTFDNKMGFLANLVKVFPSLATRPLHLTGESYAGVSVDFPIFIRRRLIILSPQIYTLYHEGDFGLSLVVISYSFCSCKAYFSMAKPPVKIAKIAIGDGSIAADEVFELLPVVSSFRISNYLSLTRIS
jgi:carboxypeptidase D